MGRSMKEKPAFMLKPKGSVPFLDCPPYIPNIAYRSAKSYGDMSSIVCFMDLSERIILILSLYRPINSIMIRANTSSRSAIQTRSEGYSTSVPNIGLL